MTTSLHASGDHVVGAQDCDCSEKSFVGDLDEVAIYDKALTETRTMAHYAAAK